jgi:ferric-dicitrate binding protein FerR (iron transport regulator)
MTREISCELAARWLSRAIDEEISVEDERLLESHLDTCPACRAERERLAAEIARLESGFAGISRELDDLLRGKLGPEGIPERSGASPRVPLAGALAALALLSVFAAYWFVGRSEERGGRAIVEWGSAGLERTSGGVPRWHEGAGRAELDAGDRIRLLAGGDASFELPGGSRARLGPDGVLALRAVGEETELELVAGRAAFEVQPGSPFRVLTPLAMVEVTGTLFGVVHEGERTEVEVSEGEVTVRRRIGASPPIRLAPGQWVWLTRSGMRFDSGGPAAPAPSGGESALPPGTGAAGGAGEGGRTVDPPAGAPSPGAPWPGGLDLPH